MRIFDTFEIMIKDSKYATFYCDPKNEWRYQYSNGTLYISGATSYTLLVEGWKLVVRLQCFNDKS